jgi:hypothetical protein
MTSDQVFVLRNGDGRFRAKCHAYDSSNCPGRRAHDVQHPEEDYVLVRRDALPPELKPCGFCAKTR